MVSLVVLALSLSFVPHEVATCANTVDAETPARRSRTGFIVALKIHTEDDHGKNTHLCTSNYTVSVGQPEGGQEQAYPVTSVDDEWGRKIEFWVEGFTSDGNRAVTVISDGRPPSFDIMIFDRRTRSVQSLLLPAEFLRRIGNCAATLRVSGTSGDDFVIATEARDNCRQAASWRLTPGNVVAGVQETSAVRPLSSGAEVLSLDPGTAVQAKP